MLDRNSSRTPGRRLAFDPLLLRRFDRTGTRNAQFVSYLRARRFDRIPPHRFERTMRRRRLAAQVVCWLLVAGFGWVLLESARALAIF